MLAAFAALAAPGSQTARAQAPRYDARGGPRAARVRGPDSVAARPRPVDSTAVRLIPVKILSPGGVRIRSVRDNRRIVILAAARVHPRPRTPRPRPRAATASRARISIVSRRGSGSISTRAPGISSSPVRDTILSLSAAGAPLRPAPRPLGSHAGRRRSRSRPPRRPRLTARSPTRSRRSGIRSPRIRREGRRSHAIPRRYRRVRRGRGAVSRHEGAARSRCSRPARAAPK